MSDGGLGRVDFFVSHAGPDAGWAAWVDHRLRDADFTTITDVYDFAVGQNFMLLMNDALERADRLLLLLTPQSIDRYMVETEWTNAMAAARDRVVPVIVEPCRKPTILTATIHIDLTTFTEDDLATAELIGRLRGVERPTDGELVAFPGEGRDVSPDVRFPARSSLVFSPQIPPRDPFFTGREDLLRDLDTGLRSGGAVALTQSIEGLGGVGKTALAIEHCHRARSVVDIVWWVRAEQPEVALGDLAGLAGHLGIQTADAGVEDVAHAVRDRLGRCEPRWLLVLDNVEGVDVLDDLRPVVGNGQVLITARKLPASAKVEAVSIEVLRRADAVAMLQTRLPNEGDAALDRLAERMGGLALALDQAAAYVIDTGATVDDYLEMLQREGLSAGDDAASERTVHHVFATSMERAAALDPMARTLMGVVAFLAPDAIPRSLFTDGAKDVGELAHGKASEVDAVLAVLLRLALVESGPPGLLRTHRLIQEVAQATVADSSSLHIATQLLWRVTPEETTPNTWGTWDQLLPHVLRALEHAEECSLFSADGAALARWTSTFLGASGSVESALALAEQVLADRERVLGADHPDTAQSRALLDWLRTSGQDEA